MTRQSDGILRLYAKHGLRPWLEERIAPHLRRWEVICRCGVCFRCTLSPELRLLWCSLREEVNLPLVIASGLRCPTRQIQVNPGVFPSMHLYGEALDIRWPENVEKKRFLETAERIVGQGGLGVYAWGIHIDTGKGRRPRRRWGKFEPCRSRFRFRCGLFAGGGAGSGKTSSASTGPGHSPDTPCRDSQGLKERDRNLTSVKVWNPVPTKSTRERRRLNDIKMEQSKVRGTDDHIGDEPARMGQSGQRGGRRFRIGGD